MAGPKVALGAPLLLDGLLGGDPEAKSRLRTLLLPSGMLGFLVGVVIVLLDLWGAVRHRS